MAANFQCPNCKQKMRIGGLFLANFDSRYEGSSKRQPVQCHGCSMMVYPEAIAPEHVYTNGTVIFAKNKEERTAITLVELLCAITIIGILISLILAAVGSVRDTFRRTQAKDEIAQFHAASSFFKQKYGSPPIWFGSRIPPQQKFRLCSSYVDRNGNFLKESDGSTWPEVSVILTIFPTIDMKDNGFRIRGTIVPSDMPEFLTPTQWYFFLLTGGEHLQFSGLCENQRQPFSPPLSLTEKRSQFLTVHNPRKFWNMELQEYDGYWRDPWDKPYVVHLPKYTYGQQYGSTPVAEQMKNSVQITSSGRDKVFGTDDDLFNWK